MVRFAEENEIKNFKDPFETHDPLPLNSPSPIPPLDFDSIQLWFDADSSADMPALHDNNTELTNSDPSIHIIAPTVLSRFDSIEAPQCDRLVTLSDSIEEGVGKISLAVGFEEPLETGGNATQCQVLVGQGESSESENSSTSSSSPSSTSSASSCSSDSVGHSDDNNEERKHPDKKEGVICEELEEGEIRESDDVRGLVAKTAAVVDDDYEEEESVEDMVSWSAKVVVEGLEKHDPLDEGSILWMPESRTLLGFVDEVFRPVRNPY